MVLIEITDFHAENLYEYSFDQMVDTFKPLTNKDDKKFIKARTYPIIFKLLPLALKKDYRSLSLTSTQIYATRLGLAKISHDPRITQIIDICTDALGDATTNNLDLCFNAVQRSGYMYVTPTSSIPLNIATKEEVKSFVVEKSDYIGLPESQLGVVLFLIGIESASMSNVYRDSVKAEINAFWKFLDRRIQVLTAYGFRELGTNVHV